MRVLLFFGLAVSSWLFGVPAWGDEAAQNVAQGKRIYNYYCYQCHGYNGDARTLASTFLNPPPRDFTKASPSLLSREVMLRVVAEGRSNTAMVGFGGALESGDIEAVVDYVRSNFMAGGAKPVARYHTRENGWPDHDKYAIAFPFADGSLPLDTPAEQLTEGQMRGKRLFMSACISCHDRAHVVQRGPVWDLRAVSYPPGNYEEHDEAHSNSESTNKPIYESPHELHEQKPVLLGATPAERNGERLFQQNCAFCHAEDGSGRNWIGTFLEPHPTDLRKLDSQTDRAVLIEIISQGMPGTSMPGWRDVLNSREIQDVIAYMKKVFYEGRSNIASGTDTTRYVDQSKQSMAPGWRRH